jgi:hypothetical protein
MQRSETIVELAKALAEFNKELSRISKDAKNPYHNNSYTTLDNILDTIRPLLAKHGISVLQMPSGNGETIEMRTLLLHTSGEFIESPVVTMKAAKSDPQSLGSTITYAKRYALSAMLGISTGDKDDDGNSGSNVRNQNAPVAPSAPKSAPSASEYKASEKQVQMIETKLTQLAKKADTTREALLQKLQIQNVNDLTSKQASALIQKLIETIGGN